MGGRGRGHGGGERGGWKRRHEGGEMGCEIEKKMEIAWQPVKNPEA